MLRKNVSIKLILIFALLSLAACGGGGESGATNTASTQKNVLFVGEPVHQTLAALPTLTPLAGTSLTANVLDISALDDTRINYFGMGIAYDAQRDRLYTANVRKINIMEHASTLKGSIKASSSFTPQFPSTVHYLQLGQLFYDKQHDTLYATYSDAADYDLAIFNNVSTLSGDVPPSKIVKMRTYSPYFTVDLKRSILYFLRGNGTGRGPDDVLALMDFDKPNPTLRYLLVDSSGLRANPLLSFNLEGVAVDAEHDRLYLGMTNIGVLIVDNASASTSATRLFSDTAPDVKLITPGIVPMIQNSGWGLGLAFDPANDRLYAGFGQNFYILDQASQAKSGANVNLVLIFTSNTSVNTFAFP